MINTDAMIKMQEGLLYTNITSDFIARVRKGCVWGGFTVRGSWRPNRNFNILTPNFWPSRCVFLVLLMLNRSPWGPLCWVMAFFIASYQHLLWTPTHQGPNGPFGLMWLSLPHLVSNCLQLHSLIVLNWVI